MYTEIAEISKKEDCEFCTWATYFIMNYKITVKFIGNILSRMPNMQVLCPCYVRRHKKVMLYGQMGRYLLKIGAQWIDW